MTPDLAIAICERKIAEVAEDLTHWQFPEQRYPREEALRGWQKCLEEWKARREG